ncbi:hypothetical protein HK096_002352 [Nowakowskiella sp. JEL0078]|nr:hypothetical protein HK096_002352 [Nowakowskiella sp. JEL0078]
MFKNSQPKIHSGVSDISQHPFTKQRLPTYVPGPCLKYNDDYNLQEVEEKRESEISERRQEWQDFLAYEYEQTYSPFEKASAVLKSRGLPEMKGRGIVIVIGLPELINYLNTSVSLLRKFNCNLPIEVWSFKGEIESAHQKLIEDMSAFGAPVTFREVDDPLNFFPLTKGEIDGYHAKIGAVTNSRFEEILFLDVDNMVIANPEYLFDSEEYRTYGTLFWPDYWKTQTFNPVWSWMGQSCVDEWEQESGVMIIDKRRSWKALSLLWFVSKDDKIRSWTYDFLLGDKDLFRFSWKAAGVSAHFIQHWVSPGGFMTPRNENGTGELGFCGIAMIQHDIYGKPLFAHLNFLKHNNKRHFNASYIPIQVIKSYIPLEEPEPSGPTIGSKMAWAGTRGARANILGVGGYVCVDIEDGLEREGVERKAQITPIANFNPEFENDLYLLLIKDMVRI